MIVHKILKDFSIKTKKVFNNPGIGIGIYLVIIHSKKDKLKYNKYLHDYNSLCIACVDQIF